MMKLKELIPTSDQLKLAQGIEKQLLERKRAGIIVSGIVTLSGAILQILLTRIEAYQPKDMVKQIFCFFQFIWYILSLQWGELHKYEPSYELAGVFVMAIGLGIYFLFKRTKLLLRESEEPFRYTFWVEPFKRVKKESDKPFDIDAKDLFHEGDEKLKNLLHLDLTERLNSRIRRLSLLDATTLGTSGKGKDSELTGKDLLTSHIHIQGHYTIRKEKDEEVVMHVMPEIRIGPPGMPATLASPIKYALEPPVKENDRYALRIDKYYHLVEQVYSSVATEAYRRIESDVKEKMKLFPTSYLRAVALFHEAEDFVRSNTIDAYDRAIELYREARRHFHISPLKLITGRFIEFPILLWRLGVKYQQTWARVEIGYAKCLIYRRLVSALSGQYKNPLFEIPFRLGKVIDSLEKLQERIANVKENNKLSHLMAFLTFPEDSWWRCLSLRPLQSLFETHRRILFNAYVVDALAHYYLEANEKARQYLDDARAVAPERSERDALYLLAAGTIEPELERAILLFRQATESAPDFQIAQYLLAYFSEMRFRREDEMFKGKAESIIKEYDQVLEINPGNIAALAAQGYLWWLLRGFDKAKKKFEEGTEIKAIARQTFIGELNYGLARIAAEEGDFNKSYGLYNQAISADPGIGAYLPTAGSSVTTSYYAYIGPGILERYRSFKNDVRKNIEGLEKTPEGRLKDKDGIEFSLKTTNAVLSFVLNDFGNACLNYYHRFGTTEKLEDAISAFVESTTMYPENAVGYYNLHNAYGWAKRPSKEISACLDRAEKIAPDWPVLLISSAKSHLRFARDEIKKLWEDVEQGIKQVEINLAKLKGIEDILAKDRERGIFRISQAELKGAITPQKISRSFGAPDEISRTEQSKLETQEEVQKHLKKAAELYHNAKDRSKDYVQVVLPKVEKIIKRTKLSSVYEGMKFDINGQGVNDLISQEIERDRLDENDAEALRVWAELLSSNLQNEEALRAAEKLCGYILEKYYPGNFNENMVLQEMFINKRRDYRLKSELEEEGSEKGISDERMQYGEKMEEYNKKIETCKETIKFTVKNWLDQDPIHYASLMWVPGIFEGEEFITLLERAIKKGPVGAVCFANLGDAFRLLKKWDDAEKAYQEALKLEPNQASYQNMLGNIYYEDGGYEKSIGPYKRAVEIDPQVAVYHTNLGGSFRALKKWEEAERAYQEAIRLEPNNADYQNTLGNICFEAAQFEKSIEFYKKAIEVDPKMAVYRANLGGSFRALGRWEEAEKAYQEAIRLEPNNAGYQNMLGNIYLESGNYEKSIRPYKRAIEIDPNIAVYHANLGGSLRGLRRWEEAERAYQEALKLEPNQASYQNMLGNIYYEDGGYEKSIGPYKRAVEIDPQVAVYHTNLAGSFRALKKWEEAERAYQEAIRLEPNNADYQNTLGNICFEAAQFEKSIEFYKKAIEVDPKMAVYRANLGGSFRALGRWEEAEKAYQEAIRLEPNNAGYQNMLGNIYLESGNYEKAIRPYKRAVEIDPNIAVYHANLGGSLRGLRRWEEAERAYQEAIRLEPNNAGYQNMLGNIYLESGNYEKSIGPYKRAIEIDPNIAVHHANLGLAFINLQKLEEAIKACQKAIKIEPNNSGYHNSLGNAYYRSGDYRKSVDSYKVAIQKDPRITIYRANLILAYTGLGKIEDAEKACHEAIDIDPNSPVYQNDLGKAFEMNKDYRRAAEQYLKAIKLNPQAKEYLSSLILVCELFLDLKKAIPLLESASKLISDNAEVNQVIERLRKIVKN